MLDVYVIKDVLDKQLIIGIERGDRPDDNAIYDDINNNLLLLQSLVGDKDDNVPITHI